MGINSMSQEPRQMTEPLQSEALSTLPTCDELHEKGICNLDWRKSGKCPNDPKDYPRRKE